MTHPLGHLADARQATCQKRGAALMCYDSWRERGPLAAVDAESRSLRKEVTRYARRTDAVMLREVAAPLGRTVQVYICGPTGFGEAANDLAGLGLPAAQIRTERLGPTGGPP